MKIYNVSDFKRIWKGGNNYKAVVNKATEFS
jgi:hypothetical protein